MSQSANVRSVEAIHEFKVALNNFADEGRNALSSVEMEVRRTRDWLGRDQLTYWQAKVKRCNEELSTARTELHRRRLSQQGSDAVSDSEQKENVRFAQRKLDEAEQRVALVKRLIPVLDHAISEYHASSQPLGDRLTGSLVASMALLDRMVVTLETYLAATAVSVGDVPTPTSLSAGPAGIKSAVSVSNGDAPSPATVLEHVTETVEADEKKVVTP